MPQGEVLKYLEKHSFVSAQEIAAATNASVNSVWRALEKLHEQHIAAYTMKKRTDIPGNHLVRSWFLIERFK